MIEDEAEKENVFSSDHVVNIVAEKGLYADEGNIGMQRTDERSNENELENEKLTQRNISRVSMIVNTTSSLSPSPSSTGLGMSPMTGTITPTTQITQERYTVQ